MKVLIWGTGKQADLVFHSLKDGCKLIGFIDSDKKKQNTLWNEKYVILSPETALKREYDLIIISPINFQTILLFCNTNNVPREKIIIFEELKESNQWIDIRDKKIVELEKKCRVYEARLENQKYELGFGEFPIILPAEELLKEILYKKKSLIRFGDGELEIMCKRERLWYQPVNDRLTKMLNEIFLKENKDCLIAVSNNFSNLNCYTEEAADGIRLYLYKRRSELINLIGTKRVFYDAYVSRPYLIFRDKERANQIFSLFKQIWNDRNIIMVEGIHTRTGVNNDLFDNAKSIQRILCPATNAFDVYEKILNAVQSCANKQDLILITLGPTATILAYELSSFGFQALDLGQLDNEYEWFLRKTDERVNIPGKTVAEISWCREPEELLDNEYRNQIICKVV